MVFCTIFTALDLIRVVISFRISVRFLVCWLGGCPVTVSAFRSASSILIRDPKCLPKVWARPQARPENFFSTSKFSIADWKGGMGHGFEKFIRDCAVHTRYNLHMRHIREFFKDSWGWGVASEVAATLALALGIWEHT